MLLQEAFEYSLREAIGKSLVKTFLFVGNKNSYFQVYSEFVFLQKFRDFLCGENKL